MLVFDEEKLFILIWDYGRQQGTISPETWEKIISESVGGQWIGGDKYMADAVCDEYGMNIKAIKKSIAKGHKQVIEFIQSRIPIEDEHLLTEEEKGTVTIKTLVQKREDSINDFNLTDIYDIVIIHYREGDDYHVRIFCDKQMDYDKLDLNWSKGVGRLKGSSEKDPWIMKRNSGSSTAYQNCVSIKKTYLTSKSIFDMKIKTPYVGDVNFEDSKRRYERYQSEGTIE